MYLCMHLLIMNMNFIGYMFISPTSRGKKNTEALVIVSKETGLDVNADKTKYMVMSREQNAGRSYNKRLIIVSLKGWKSSNIWEQPQWIKF